MRPQGTAAALEARRREAIRLLQEGRRQADVARRLGTTRTSVGRWWKAYRRGGPRALRAKPPPGRPPHLTRRQKRGLVRRLLQRARANGFATDLWTCPRIAQLIARRYGVTYHVDSLPKFLHALGFSCQKPEKRAFERHDAVVARWVARQGPRIKKRPRG
jgi:transposase